MNLKFTNISNIFKIANNIVNKLFIFKLSIIIFRFGILKLGLCLFKQKNF